MAGRRLGLVLQRHLGLVRCCRHSSSSGRDSSGQDAPEFARILRGLESIMKEQETAKKEREYAKKEREYAREYAKKEREYAREYAKKEREYARMQQDAIKKTMASMKMTLDMVAEGHVKLITGDDNDKE